MVRPVTGGVLPAADDAVDVPAIVGLDVRGEEAHRKAAPTPAAHVRLTPVEQPVGVQGDLPRLPDPWI